MNLKPSPSELLRNSLGRLQRKRPAYSSRALARDLGVSSGYMSMILSGKRSVPIERAEELADILGMEAAEKSLFFQSLSEKNEKNRKKLKIKTQSFLEYDQITQDKFNLMSDRYHIAFMDLCTTSQFKNDLCWIAKKLKITELAAQDIRNRLLRLGLITETPEGSLKKTHKKFYVPTSGPNETIRKFHDSMIEAAKEELSIRSPKNIKNRFIGGVTLSVEPNKIKEAKATIDRFQEEIVKLCSTASSTEVYQLNIQFFPLTTPEGDLK
ncbi:MAG: hypothetical protein CL678_03520 [Bdellovibrionaceae bacterium]|nr:hypothetical protein [Pseudobdellovibrionaceae bacterium]